MPNKHQENQTAYFSKNEKFIPLIGHWNDSLTSVFCWLMWFHQALSMDTFFHDTIEQKGPVSDTLQ